MSKILCLAVGSLAGGMARYFLAGGVQRIFGGIFPYGTLAVNLSGCFLVGLLSALAHHKFAIGPNSRILLIVGFCGAFTTLSTLILETDYLLEDGQALAAFLNVMASAAAGFVLFRAGAFIGDQF